MAAKPKLKLYQVRVFVRGEIVYRSETSDEKTARARAKRVALASGVGAIGTAYRVARKQHNTFVPIYEARCVHAGKTGKPALVTEDHETLPRM